MSVELESAARLAALRDKANATTGETADTLAGAVDALIAGYGQGGGGEDTLLKLIKKEITEFETDEAISIPNNLFQSCSKLTRTSTPKATGYGNYCIATCYALTYVDFGNTDTLSTYTMLGSHYVKTIILRKNTVVKLTGSLDNSNNIKNGICLFYVPSALIDGYKTATNWTAYANQFRALEDYTVDGTTTGAFDESKIV